ncbi:LytR C-terminal domain-containing protein [Gleimia sp. 6138-11-ORH1]|uniref:LytR C-terminal domain-containing protein n=1 Tax=Gleimia sp. 6138-11-ORH1 TaxID=2973937 RepID=UPI002169111B|nr:LytR C-terminal domain-containing protein [Gleimia sp. 6138-11-ORH1]MCS4484731.1 LytR C-terminal domain-containing protein [Gleimia sp. 6138-11-ORH1]
MGSEITPRQMYRKRRQRRQGKVFNLIVAFMGITSLVAVLILVGFIKFPYYNTFNKVQRFAEPGSIVCIPKDTAVVPLEGVPIKVFNGTSRPGLADQVGSALQGVGLDFQEKANYSGTFFGGVRIVTNGKQLAQAYSVARLFENSHVVYDPNVVGPLHVIVGDAFSEMKSAEELKKLVAQENVILESYPKCLPLNPKDLE